MKYIALIFLISLFIEAFFSFKRVQRRKGEYEKATQLSKKLGKKLLVIGAPNNGGYNKIFGPSYKCGDVCVDIIGCTGCKRSIQGDLLEVLKTMPSNQYVIFESCTLEYIDREHNNIIYHIKRVSGNDYFNVRVGHSLYMYIFYVPALWTGEKYQPTKWIDKY